LSPGVEEIASVAGGHARFAEAREKVVPKLAGLRLGESTVERTTEAAGRRRAAVQASGPSGEAEAEWAWHGEAEGKTVA
jgi:hypothetical protein